MTQQIVAVTTKLELEVLAAAMDGSSSAPIRLDADALQQCVKWRRSSMNFRERQRMQHLNEAFLQLKSKLPWIPSDSKLTKLEILRFAAEYIRYLTILLPQYRSNSSLQQ